MAKKSFHIPQIEPHPLKKPLEATELKLWQIRGALGGRPSEAMLSKYLNGHIQMPEHVEKKLNDLIQYMKEIQDRPQG